MNKLELLKIIIDLSPDADNKEFRNQLSEKNTRELLETLVEIAIFYKNEYDS